jgi:hypothetical protein
MELWLDAEIRIRRDDALEGARRCRLSRLAATGRTPKVRSRVADGVQAISDVFAALARSLRNGEAA